MGASNPLAELSGLLKSYPRASQGSESLEDPSDRNVLAEVFCQAIDDFIAIFSGKSNGHPMRADTRKQVLDPLGFVINQVALQMQLCDRNTMPYQPTATPQGNGTLAGDLKLHPAPLSGVANIILALDKNGFYATIENLCDEDMVVALFHEWKDYALGFDVGPSSDFKSDGSPDEGEYDEKRLQVYADGQWHDVTERGLQIIKALLKYPGAWLPGKQLKTPHAKYARPDHAIKALPEALQQRIESHKAKGYRWMPGAS